MGSRIDEPLTMTRSSTTYYYLTDGLGSVRQLTNSSGTIVESYDYDPYGGTTIYDSSLTDITSSGSGIDNPYMFTGHRFDEETSIYHYRRRAYDPEIGRFLQRDPLGYAAGMNLFEYAWNSPVNWIDPLGLFCENLEEEHTHEEIIDEIIETIEDYNQEVADRAGGSENPPESDDNGKDDDDDDGFPPPGKPTAEDGFFPPKGKPTGKKDDRVPNPNGHGKGWLNKYGRVWVPTTHDGTHAPHWDVQDPITGTHEPVYPKPKS